MVEIFLLEQLITFAKCGTLSKAAEELHITQPALSRSMKKLENEFGVSLFDREKSKISLNETGKIATYYAQKVLDADHEMLEKTIRFDRSIRTITVGACAILPIHTLTPLLHEYFHQKTIASEITNDTDLISGLKNHSYQLAILHKKPIDKNIFCQKYMDEHLYISIPEDHPLSLKKSITFSDLAGMSILAHGSSGFWIDLCKEHITNAKLLVQDDIDVLHELIESSSLPAFYSDRAKAQGYRSRKRIALPIDDPCAYVTYYLSCLHSEKVKYQSIFRAIDTFLGSSGTFLPK